MLSTRKALLAVLVLLLLAAVAAPIIDWHIENQVGRFSYTNYQRISNGMELSEVESLLGTAGEEITHHQLPGVRPDDKIPGSPDGWLGVVWGDRFFRWLSDYRVLHVGIQNGRVISKYFTSYSL